MSWPDLGELIALIATRRPGIVLIDGPSGAGKSTLADRLAAFWPGPEVPVIVRMDDVYPGWAGLDEGSTHIGRYLLAPLAQGQSGRWRQYSWTPPGPGEWHTVEHGVPVIVEGCGTISRSNAPYAHVRVWLDADDDIRKRRALQRDHGGFDDHWDMWQRQFEAFVAREHPRSLADVWLSGT